MCAFLGAAVLALLLAFANESIALEKPAPFHDVINDQKTPDSNSKNLHLERLDIGNIEISITDICCGKKTIQSHVLRENRLFTKSGLQTYWFKVLPSQTGVLEITASVDRITLHRVNSKNDIISRTIGDTIATSSREIVTAKLAFPISQNDLEGALYLEITHGSKIVVEFNLFSNKMFQQTTQTHNALHAFLVGGIAIIALYNFIISLLTRNKPYFFNSVTIVSLLFLDFYISGIGAAFIWPSAVEISNFILIGSICLGIVAGSQFLSTFLKTPSTSKRILWRALRYFPPLALASFLLIFVFPYWVPVMTSILLAALLLLTTFVLIFIESIRGNIRARLMLPTMALSMFPGLLIVLLERVFGFHIFFFASHLLEICLFFEALLLSLVLAYHVEITKNENTRTNQLLVQIQNTRAVDIIDAIDSERKRIASDLHDSAGQAMMAIVNRLNLLSETTKNITIKSTTKTQHEIKKASEHSRQVIDDLRRISHDLHPASLDFLGWQRAIKELFDRLEKLDGIKSKIVQNVSKDMLNKTEQVHLFRIVQELVSNISKHASATTCNARFEIIDDSIIVKINDDGENESQAMSHGVGTAIIDQRVKILAGTWQRETNQMGTIVTITFPLSMGEKLKESKP